MLASGVLLAVVTLGALVLRSSESRNKALAAANSDISFRVVGFTNDPPVVMPSATSIGVVGSGLGLHALFSITNTSSVNFMQFETAAVERYEDGIWKEFTPVLEGSPTNQWAAPKGSFLAPGYGCVIAVAWPGIPTNCSWRLRI